MKQFSVRLILISIIFLWGYFYPVNVQGQKARRGESEWVSSRSSSASSDRETSGDYGNSVSKAPPGGGESIGELPIGPGLPVLIGLSFSYLLYVLKFKPKKEEK